MGRLLVIALVSGAVLAGAAGFLASDLLSQTGKATPTNATLYNYGQR